MWIFASSLARCESLILCLEFDDFNSRAYKLFIKWPIILIIMTTFSNFPIRDPKSSWLVLFFIRHVLRSLIQALLSFLVKEVGYITFEYLITILNMFLFLKDLLQLYIYLFLLIFPFSSLGLLLFMSSVTEMVQV